MRIVDTRLPGVFILEADKLADERGMFSVLWSAQDASARGLETTIVQCNVSANRSRGTLRGLHYQAAPFSEVKIVRATRGAVYDVAVDLRRDSPTYLQWTGVELDAAGHRQMYLPAGIAHGYQTLTEDAEIVYFVSAPYSPPHQRGVRWNDAAFGIEWPMPPVVMNDRDRSYPDFGS